MAKTYVDADIQIPGDDPEQKPTRQVGNGLVEQVILPRGAAVLLNAENIPLMPLEMSEESRYEKKDVAIGILGGGTGFVLASEVCCPGAGIITHAVFAGLIAVGCGLFGRRTAKNCDDRTPMSTALVR